MEILEKTIPTFFIKGADELQHNNIARSFNIHNKTIEERTFLPNNYPLKIAITSGASCPDAIVDRVMMKILDLIKEPCTIDEAFLNARI